MEVHYTQVHVSLPQFGKKDSTQVVHVVAYHSLARRKNGTTTAGNPDEKVGFDLIQSLVKNTNHMA